jgi:hypothetical protein
MASPKNITSFTGNLSDRFCQDSLKCLVCLDDLTEQRGLVEFPCCNNIFACLCCFMELIVVNQTTIAPCCRRPLTFVRSAGSAMRLVLERERREAERQLEITQLRRRTAEQDLARIQTQNSRYEEEQHQIAHKLAMLRSTQEQQEREAKVAFEARKLQEQTELKMLEQRRQLAIQKEMNACARAEAQKRRRDIERKIMEYISEINKPKFPAAHYKQVFQNLCKLLSKYHDMEEFILTSFSEIRGIDILTETIATELKTRTSEIHGNRELSGIVRLQIMAINSLEYKSPICETYYKNYLYSFQPSELPRDVYISAIKHLNQPISLDISGTQLVVSYHHTTGFSFVKKSPSSVIPDFNLPTNVELNARLSNVFALCDVVNTDTTSISRQRCLAAFTLDAADQTISVHLLEYDLYELFGAEDVFINNVGHASMPPEIAVGTSNPFLVTKYSIDRCGKDLLHPTTHIKNVIRFY